VPKPKREWDPQLIAKWAINGKLENLLSCWKRERRGERERRSISPPLISKRESPPLIYSHMWERLIWVGRNSQGSKRVFILQNFC
jgi:hypothetical protein